MSYLFPKRVLRTGDVMNPIELTEDIAPAADAVSGRLNAHNFSTLLSSTVAVDPEAFYKPQYTYDNVEIYWLGQDPTYTPGPGQWGVPDEGTVSGDEVLVQNNFEWQSLVSVDGNTTSISMTTGTSVLWINAYVQYIWWGFNFELIGEVQSTRTGDNQHFNGAQKYPANMQFALRVDGTILPETITGIDDVTYRASVPIKPTSQTQNGIFPGPADMMGKQLAGLGPPVLPVRVGACYPVQPGDHVIELVFRRVPYVSETYVKQYGPIDRIYLYNRQIHVVDLKMFPVDSVAAAETTVDAFDAETPLSQTSLYTDRVQRVVTAYNAVKEGSLQRGALTHTHVPSTLLNAASTEQDYGTGRLHNNWFPGHNTDTVTTTVYSGAPGTGWAEIKNLEVSNFTVGERMRVLVLANLQVKNIYGNRFALAAEEISGYVGSTNDFALFKIMWQYTTDGPTNWNGVQQSLGMVNNFAWWPQKEDLTPPNVNAVFGLENVEVQLMAEISFPAAQPHPINIGLFGSVANDNTQFLYTRGSIQAIGLRD